MPVISRFWFSRKISRSRRLTRLRITAWPIRRVVMMPSRAVLSPARYKTPKVTCRPDHAFPSFLTSANSAVRVIREALGNLKRSRLPGAMDLSLGMSGVVIFRSDWQQPLPTTLATPSKSSPSAFGFHPGTKTVLTLSGALGSLVSSFHGNISWILGVGKDSRGVRDVKSLETTKNCLIKSFGTASQILYATGGRHDSTA
jgi:hypothetical protein